MSRELWELLYPIGMYAVAAAALAIISHLLVRQFETACLIGAGLCSVLNFVHQEWVSNFAIKPGWAVPLFMFGFMFALPVCFAVGLPFRATRASRRQAAKPGVAADPDHGTSW